MNLYLHVIPVVYSLVVEDSNRFTLNAIKRKEAVIGELGIVRPNLYLKELEAIGR